MSAGRMTLCAAVVAAGLGLARPAAASPTEAEVMTEFIERFTLFVDWPADALGGPGETFVVCVVGAAAVQAPLTALARSRTIKGRRAVVRTIDGGRSPEAIAGCHVAFIAGSEGKHLSLLLGHAQGRPVLTVASTPGFADAGVVINFVRKSKNLGFEINPSAAASGRLKVRSNLLRLGRLVGGP
jgi:hypothetical protein